MKKRLIVVGNKPITKDISEIVDGFDYVVRINRMTNYGMTGTKTDAVYLGAWNDFTYIFNGGEYKEVIKQCDKIFMCIRCHSMENYKKFINEDQEDHIQVFNFDLSSHRMGTCVVTSSVRIVDCLVNSPEWSEKYDIFITGIDTENRQQLFDTQPEWKLNTHRAHGCDEERYLKKLLAEGKIHKIEDGPARKMEVLNKFVSNDSTARELNDLLGINHDYTERSTDEFIEWVENNHNDECVYILNEERDEEKQKRFLNIPCKKLLVLTCHRRMYPELNGDILLIGCGERLPQTLYQVSVKNKWISI